MFHINYQAFKRYDYWSFQPRLVLVKNLFQNWLLLSQKSVIQNSLEALLLMIIEQELFLQIDYDDIIDKFKNIVPHNRRLIL